MYHTFTLGSLTIALTGVGVICFLISFLFVVYRESTYHSSLRFSEFFRYSPLIIVLSYCIGSRGWYLINELIIVPTSSEQILLYLSPVGWKFSLLGIIAGILLGVSSFLKKQPVEDRIIWIDIFFKALCWGCIPLGIFLVLGDSFIGLPTESSIGISAIKVDSALALYNKVLPIGLGVSILGIIGVTILSFAKKTLRTGYGYAGIAWILLGVAYITIYQNYARRILSSVAGIRLDSKQYVLVITALIFFGLRWNHKRSQDTIIS